MTGKRAKKIASHKKKSTSLFLSLSFRCPFSFKKQAHKVKAGKADEAGEALKVKAPKVSSGGKKGRASASERKKNERVFFSWIARKK